MRTAQLRKRHGHHLPRRHLGIRPDAIRRRKHQPNARSARPLRLNLQLSLVHSYFDHPLPQQDRSLQGEARSIAHLQLLPRLSGRLRFPGGVRLLLGSLRLAQPEQREADLRSLGASLARPCKFAIAQVLAQTCATDTRQIKFVLSAVNDIIIQVNLRDCVRLPFHRCGFDG